jgi:predicted metal-dependent hydrolase
MPPLEPSLEGEDARAFRTGVDQFNAGLFFECHDTLEEVWVGVRGPSRDFFQGLIQVSVAFYHLTGGNSAGALSMLSRALSRFEAYPDRYFGFELGAHRRELVDWLGRIRAGVAQSQGLEELPKWRFAIQGPPRE